MRVLKVFCISFFLLFSGAAGALASGDGGRDLSILRVTPGGSDVPAGRQVVIQFNRPVVPVGRMDRGAETIPVDISPELKCQWRWLNTSALACNLDSKDGLRLATRYTVTVRPGLTAEDGATIDDVFVHSFTTKRPDVRYVWFRRWLSPREPVVRLTFDQPVTRRSLETCLTMETVGEDEDKSFAVKASADPQDKDAPVILPVPGAKAVVVFAPSEPQKSDDDLREKDGDEARRVWQVSPVDPLPSDTDIRLDLKPGLVSALGDERGAGRGALTKFRTFPGFSFLGVKCYGSDNDIVPVVLAPGQAEPQKLCNPMKGAALVFNSPVLRSAVGKTVSVSPGFEASSDLWNGRDSSQLGDAYVKDKTYDIWLPDGIKAAFSYTVRTKGDALLEDEFGRPLQEDIDFSFRTDHRKPNYEIVHSSAVLEQGIDSDVPLYVNNLRKASLHYRRLTAQGAQEGLVFEQDIPEVPDVQFAVPFHVRDMLEGKSGAVYGHLATDPSVPKNGERGRLLAMVTPYQLHAKLGHCNSLVWVTDLATGLPVSGAKVAIYKDSIAGLRDGVAPLSEALTSEDGVAVLAGTQTLDPMLQMNWGWRDEQEKLFVRADKDGEMALMPLSHEFLINGFRSVGESVYSHTCKRYGHVVAWGTTAQGVYKAGDTIQYKFYVRDQDNDGFVPAPRDGYSLEIVDPAGNKVHEVKDLSLSSFGAYSGEFTVSKQGAVGWYRFRLSNAFGEGGDGKKRRQDVERGHVWIPMRVLVSDFTPSPFKVTNGLNGDLFRAKQEVEVSSLAKLHSGGAYGDANIRVTAMLQSRRFAPKTSEAKDFSFG
ncbi:MAG: MG2 domain-containing protein, partial [Alphaproteobacteria bacterium]|nr:MG2 domain-containing protein [Alphaproteobacteria bacterium]